MSKKCKNALIIIITAIIAFIIISMAYIYITRPDQINPIDWSVMEDTNKIRQAKLFEEFNYIENIIVQKLDGGITGNTISCYDPDHPDVSIKVNLSVDDICKLDIGDIIAVQGHMSYNIQANTLNVGNYVHDDFPFTDYKFATLIDVKER